MLYVNKFLNIRFQKYLEKMSKQIIFTTGSCKNNTIIQLSGLHCYTGSDKILLPHHLFECYNFTGYNYSSSGMNKLKLGDNFLLDHKEYHFVKNDKPYKNMYNVDILQNYNKPSYTFVYYYSISPDIKGGELEFENGQKYTPQEYDIICFDGNTKYTIHEIYGKGSIGTLIMIIDKIE
jgi:hypothetical protein